MNNNFSDVVTSLLGGVDHFLSTKTVVGEATQLGDTIILPLVDVSFGVGAGATAGEVKNGGFGGVSGKMSPSAVLVIKNGQTKLVNVKNQDTVTKIIDMIYKDIDLQMTFSGDKNTQSRLLNTKFSALIKKEDKDIGFVMIVHNARTNIDEIDMGILGKYRGKGYGSQALAQLKQIILNNSEKLDIEIETKIVNEAAIRSVMKNGFELYRQSEECLYFRLPEETKKHK